MVSTTRKAAELAALEKCVAAKDALIAQLRKQLGGSKSRRSSSKSSSSKDSAKQQKLLLADDKYALDKDEVLDEILSFVGCKEWAFVAGVCRRWRGRYFSMCIKAGRAAGAHGHSFNTSRRSTWATRARFALALDYGMSVAPKADSDSDSDGDDSDDGDDDDGDHMFDQLPLFSTEPIEVLTLARKHGAQWHERMTCDAAYYGDAALTQWLIVSGCPWDVYISAVNAIRSCNSNMDDWLESSIIRPADKAMLSKLTCEAGFAGNIGVLNLLRSNGAVWPKSFLLGAVILPDENQQACWHDTAVAWAISEGSGWLEWRCELLASDNFSYDAVKSVAEKLFKWAHENGCPCTCHKAAAAAAAAGRT